MAHKTLKTSYSDLVERLNRFPQGAPPSELLNKILKILFIDREAQLVSLLPIKPFTAQKASQIWKMDLNSTRKILDTLAGRALLVDIEQNGVQEYVLPPPMAGFFEFSMMRIRHDIDQKALGELFYQYLNIEEDFIRELFTRGETQLGRVFVNEPALSSEYALHVFDYERATEVISTASHIGVGICYCRHKMENLGRSCKAPMEICMTFNTTAASKSILIKQRGKRVLTPLNGVHKVVVMAIERGKLQHLIFDNRVLFSHRAMAAVLGVLLKLTPLKQAMAGRQIKSRFFEQLIRKIPV